MKDFYQYNRQHLLMLIIALVILAIIGGMTGCASTQQCPQTYGYDNYRPQPNKF